MAGRPFAILLAAAAVTGFACSQQSAPGGAATPPPAATAAMLQSLASSIAARDYGAAYDLVAAGQRESLTRAEFEEAFRHYRDGLPDRLKTDVRVDAYDRASASMVPDGIRDQIVAEGVVSFDPDGGQAEGFSAVVWVVMESGRPRIAHLYTED